jgi:hypothetical protein
MACWMHLEGFQVVSSHFWALVCTGLTDRGHQSDQSECWSCSHVAHRSGLSYCSCPVSSGVLHTFVQGELHWFRGSLHVCKGRSLWFFKLWFGGLCSLLEHSFVSVVSSRCPCLRGLRLVFLKWSCSSFDRLLEFSFYSFFSSSFLSCYFMWVLSMHSSRGRLRTMCGFEDRWMVIFLCDEWLTTLCGLILG